LPGRDLVEIVGKAQVAFLVDISVKLSCDRDCENQKEGDDGKCGFFMFYFPPNDVESLV